MLLLNTSNKDTISANYKPPCGCRKFVYMVLFPLWGISVCTKFITAACSRENIQSYFLNTCSFTCKLPIIYHNFVHQLTRTPATSFKVIRLELHNLWEAYSRLPTTQSAWLSDYPSSLIMETNSNTIPKGRTLDGVVSDLPSFKSQRLRPQS